MSLKIVIIGSGASGMLTACQLHHMQPEAGIYLLEADPSRTGKGLAYSTDDMHHLLNVPAGKMSALADEPGHFLEWLHNSGHVCSAGDFMPRKLYGNYLRSILRSLKEQVQLLQAEVVAIRNEPGNLSVQLKDGRSLEADKVVLALGNFPPTAVKAAGDEYKSSPYFFADPWPQNIFKGLQETDPVFILGTGLTMVDMVVSLHHRKHKGHIRVVSTHGFLPQAHEVSAPYPDFYEDLKNCRTVNSLTIKIHRHLARAGRQGLSWRAVIDAIRPHTQELWIKLPVHEKEEFMDKVRHIWGVARHRMPQQSAVLINEMLQDGRLLIKAARLKEIETKEDGLQLTYSLRSGQQPESFFAKRLINCTGPESDYDKVPSALVKQLLNDGMITKDPLHLGMNTTPEGKIIDKSGKVSERLFTIGPCMKGILWECTAIPEIRVQAKKLAALLLKDAD